jgi:hypothetical protein
MRALIWKELREQVKLAVIGFVIAILGLLGTYSLYMATVKVVATGRWDAYQMLQPLLSELFLLGAGCFCAALGAVLGWLQIHNERHRDLWAFLVHRPVSRTDIFLGKSLAGLGLYLAVAGGPLLVFVLWLRFLGGLLAPFEWAMVLPVAAYFLAGVVYYFAGMLTALRQARWYATRGLPLLVALWVPAEITHAAHFWQALLLIGVAAGLLAVACWGGFRSQGADSGQQALGKLGLTGSLAAGGYVLGAAIAGMLLNALLFSGGVSWSAYTVTKDGRIYKSIGQSRRLPEIVDLDGKPLTDPQTGQKIDVREFNRLTSSVISVRPKFGPDPQWHDYFQQLSRYFFGWRVTPDTAWYYWRKYGRLVGFDLSSRRVIGSLGPNGFVAGMPGKDSPRFEAALGMGHNLNDREQVLCTHRAVYRVNVTDQTSTAIFTTTAEDPIGGVQPFSVNGHDWTQTLVVTRHSISLLARDGKAVWKVPYDPPYPEYTMVQVHLLEPAGQFALWMIPSEEANAKAAWKLPIQVRWLAEGQGVVKSAALPVLGERAGYDWKMKLVNVFRPAVAPWPNRAAQRAGIIDWEAVLVAVAAAGLIYIPLGWWLGRRYALSIGSRVGWGCFMLVAGFPAFVAFLAVHDWPARERCPSCRRLRVVNRQDCEHCKADFPVPQRIGTEIFEPVA